MKICIINNLAKPYSRGGADRIASLIAEGLKNKGNSIFFITTRPIGKKPDSYWTQKNYYLPSNFHYLNKIPKIFRLFWHIADVFNFINYFKINKILKKEKPDLVITHNLKGIGLLTCRAIKKQKIKHIHYLHDIQLIHPSGLIIFGEEKKIETIISKIYSAVSSWLINSPQLVISPSEWLLNLHAQKKFFKKSRQKSFLNPISPKAINHKKSKKENEKIFKFLYIAEIEKQKGALWAINSFLSLPKEIFQKCELTMLGQGSKMKEIYFLAKNKKNIKILGWQNDIEKYMNNADVLLAPSLCYDNSPTIIYEATAAGTPVIASNLGGIPELIKKFGGILISPQNKNNLTEEMVKLFKNKEKNILKDGYQKKLEKLKIDNYIKNLLKEIKN